MLVGVKGDGKTPKPIEMNECKDQWTNKWIKEWIKWRMNEWMNERILNSIWNEMKDKVLNELNVWRSAEWITEWMIEGELLNRWTDSERDGGAEEWIERMQFSSSRVANKSHPRLCVNKLCTERTAIFIKCPQKL